ncbi:hypothetical protein BsWGS_03818 [Bradybaena similaris]
MLLSLLLGSFLVFCTSRTEAVCGITPPVWRNGNFTCPDRAVCADVFTTQRDWYNGTRCEEVRTLHNCLCPGGTICPYSNPDHMLYASAQHQQYICKPVCQVPYCGNIHLTSTDNRNPLVVAQTVEQNAPEFDHRSYYKIDCRCPRHHEPFVQPPGVHRAVHVHSHTYDYLHHKYSTRFVCTTRGNQNSLPDPCASHVVNPQ